MIRTLRTLLVLACGGVCVVAFTGCNTVKGVGTDIHSAGQAGQNAISGNRSNTSTSTTTTTTTTTSARGDN